MGKSQVIVLRTAGTNCDKETCLAFNLAKADSVDLVHINQLIRKEKNLNEYNILAIPGGFSYGDDISAGKIFANEFKYKLLDQLKKFIDDNKLIIGICNGFQVLVKTGLILEDNEKATLSFNDSGKFECRWVSLKVERNKINEEIWTKNLPDIIQLPIAHAEGKFVPESKTVMNKIEKNLQVIFRYYKFNPNGSVNNVAGITNKQGNILGMMPHPERFIYKYQHPLWTANKNNSFYGVGLKIFQNSVLYSKTHL